MQLPEGIMGSIAYYICQKDLVSLGDYVRDLADWCYQQGRRENVSERSSNIGCLWYDRQNNRFSGYIDAGILGQVKIMVFPNERRQSEKSPHWNIVLQKPREEKRKPSMDTAEIPHAAPPAGNGHHDAMDDVPF